MFVETQLAGPPPPTCRVSDSLGAGWGLRVRISSKVPELLMLVDQGPCFENHWSPVCLAPGRRAEEGQNLSFEAVQSIRPCCWPLGEDDTSDSKLFPCHKSYEGGFYMLPLKTTSVPSHSCLPWLSVLFVQLNPISVSPVCGAEREQVVTSALLIALQMFAAHY